MTKYIGNDIETTGIDISKLSPGSYFVKAITDKKLISNQKLTIVK